MIPRGAITPRPGGGSGGAGRVLIHFGMLLATLAFASWWTSHTILDTARTRRATDAVLENANLRHYVAGKIASAVTPAVGTSAVSAATGTAHTSNPARSGGSALETRLDTVLDRRDIRVRLEQFVTDAHRQLIGVGTKPAVLDRGTVRTLVSAALPALSATDLAKVHAVRFDVPHVGMLAGARNTLAHRFWLFLVGALVLVTLAIVTSRDRRTTVKTVGAWLLGISAAHLVVLWILPVVVVPRVSHSPWANLIAAVARALGAGIVTGLVVLAVTGVAFLVADRFVAPAGVRGTLVGEPVPES